MLHHASGRGADLCQHVLSVSGQILPGHYPGHLPQGLFIPLVFLLSWGFGLTGLELTQAVADLLGFLVAGSILLHYFLKEFGKEEL